MRSSDYRFINTYYSYCSGIFKSPNCYKTHNTLKSYISSSNIFKYLVLLLYGKIRQVGFITSDLIIISQNAEENQLLIVAALDCRLPDLQCEVTVSYCATVPESLWVDDFSSSYLQSTHQFQLVIMRTIRSECMIRDEDWQLWFLWWFWSDGCYSQLSVSK